MNKAKAKAYAYFFLAKTLPDGGSIMLLDGRTMTKDELLAVR
jgi:hypothetical protein